MLKVICQKKILYLYISYESYVSLFLQTSKLNKITDIKQMRETVKLFKKIHGSYFILNLFEKHLIKVISQL